MLLFILLSVFYYMCSLLLGDVRDPMNIPIEGKTLIVDSIKSVMSSSEYTDLILLGVCNVLLLFRMYWLHVLVVFTACTVCCRSVCNFFVDYVIYLFGTVFAPMYLILCTYDTTSNKLEHLPIK